MGQRGYIAALRIYILMASYRSDTAQILMIKTQHNMLLYMKDKISGDTCQTNRF